MTRRAVEELLVGWHRRFCRQWMLSVALTAYWVCAAGIIYLVCQ